MRTALLLSVCCLAAALVGSPASAEMSAADKETARGLMVQGNELYDKGDYAGAIKAIKGAHSIMGVPSTGFALARAYAASGALIEARDLALEVTRMPQKANEPAAFKRARTQAEELAASLASKIPSVQIDLQGVPPNAAAEVRLDDTVVPPNLVGLPRKVNPGKHSLTATAPGFAVSRATVEVREGEQKVVTIVLTAAGQPQAAPVTTTTVKPVETAQPAPDAAPRKGPSSLTWIGFGVGAAGLITGTVTGLMTLSKASSAKSQCEGNVCQPSAQSDIDSGKTLGMVSNIGFGVGIAGVAVGVITLLASPKEAPPTPAAASGRSLRVVPVVGVGSFGLNGSF